MKKQYKSILMMEPDRVRYKGKSLRDRFWESVDIREDDECWEWTGYVAPNGYGRFGVLQGIYYTAHRVSWELAHNEVIPDGMVACHKCDNRRCANPSHIFVGTIRDNVRDMDSKGRRNTNARTFGEKHHPAKLNESQVVEISRLCETSTHPDRVIGEMFGVGKSIVNDIRHKRKWRHLLCAS